MTLSRIGNGEFGKSNAYLFCKDKYVSQNVFEITMEFLSKEDVHFSVTSDRKDENGYTVRKIYFKEKYVELPIIDGRFFNKKDVKSKSNLAIIGKDVKGICYKRDNKEYIRLGEEEYEVLGVIGYKTKLPLDNVIFVNAFSEYDLKSQIFQIDLFEGKDMDLMTENLELELKRKGFECETISKGYTYVEYLLPLLANGKLFCYLLACFFITISLALAFWINAEEKEISIKRLEGCRDSRIYLEYIKKGLTAGIVAICIGLVYCKINMMYINGLLIWVYLLYIPISLLVLILSVRRVVNKSLVEMINQC
jgi:hypothetical protein